MTYRLRDLTTTAVTVVPSAFALATAASHKSGGMRNERGMVATSLLHSECGDSRGGREAKAALACERVNLVRRLTLRRVDRVSAQLDGGTTYRSVCDLPRRVPLALHIGRREEGHLPGDRPGVGAASHFRLHPSVCIYSLHHLYLHVKPCAELSRR